jgi:ABC-type transport system involved in multi-copper enzyme maturation permease subunit
MSSPIVVIAQQAMREASRRRTLPALVIFGCGIILSSAFLSFFQLGVEIKFFKDIAMTVIFLFGTVATLVIVSTQLSGEIESRTIYNVLSKPIRRWELVLGKFAGTATAIGISIAPMVAILVFFIATDHGGSELEAVKGAYLLWLAFTVLSAVALGIASVATSTVTAALTILVFVVSYLKGAVTTYLDLLSAHPVVAYFGQALYYLLPNFENFNTRTAVVHDEFVPWAYLVRTTIYAAALVALFLYVGIQMFEEREF